MTQIIKDFPARTRFEEIILKRYVESKVFPFLTILQHNSRDSLIVESCKPHHPSRIIVMALRLILTGGFTKLIGYDDFAKLLSTPAGEPCVFNIVLPDNTTAAKAQLIIPAKLCAKLKQFEPEFTHVALTSAPDNSSEADDDDLHLEHWIFNRFIAHHAELEFEDVFEGLQVVQKNLGIELKLH